MELRQLEIFVEVAEQRHFTRAAERLDLAQPAVSQSVRALESKLGTLLFNRQPRNLQLTAAGQVLLAEARQILKATQEAETRARRAAEGKLGHLPIGYLASATAPFLPSLATDFRLRYPDVSLTLEELTPSQQHAALQEGRIQLGFTRALPATLRGEFAQKTIYEDTLVVSLPCGHPLAHREEISVRELAKEPLLLFDRSEAPLLNDQIHEIMAQTGLLLAAPASFRSMATVLLMVAAGAGWSIVPRCTQFLRQPGVVHVPIAESTPPLPLCAVWRKQAMLPTAQMFVQVVLEQQAQITSLMQKAWPPVPAIFGPDCPYARLQSGGAALA